MKKNLFLAAGALAVAMAANAVGGTEVSAAPDALGKYVADSVLPWGSRQVMSAAFACREVDALDVKCDEAWCAIRSKSEYDTYRKGLKAKMMSAMR